MSDETGSFRLAVASALGRQYSVESNEFLGYLAGILKSSMPERLVTREKGLFKKTLVGLTIELDQGRLNLDVGPGGSVIPTFTRVVKSVALKTEDLTMDEWIEMLSAAMEQLAARSEKSRNALAALINLP